MNESVREMAVADLMEDLRRLSALERDFLDRWRAERAGLASEGLPALLASLAPFDPLGERLSQRLEWCQRLGVGMDAEQAQR